MEEIRAWAPILLAAASFAFAVVSARGKAASDRVEKMETKIDETEDRVSKIEGEMRHMPDRDMAHRLELSIARLEGSVETMNERLKPVAAMAGRVHERMFEEAMR